MTERMGIVLEVVTGHLVGEMMTGEGHQAHLGETEEVLIMGVDVTGLALIMVAEEAVAQAQNAVAALIMVVVLALVPMVREGPDTLIMNMMPAQVPVGTGKEVLVGPSLREGPAQVRVGTGKEVPVGPSLRKGPALNMNRVQL